MNSLSLCPYCPWHVGARSCVQGPQTSRTGSIQAKRHPVMLFYASRRKSKCEGGMHEIWYDCKKEQIQRNEIEFPWISHIENWHCNDAQCMRIPVWVSSRISGGLNPKEGWFSVLRKARICVNDAFEVPPFFYRTTLGGLWVVRFWFSGEFRCPESRSIIWASLGVRSWFFSDPWFSRETIFHNPLSTFEWAEAPELGRTILAYFSPTLDFAIVSQPQSNLPPWNFPY